ncbi:MAG: hypothetical protein IBX55_01955 [Methyloprofundus sp.]|nr:hypothetical protein [Methyloprofundus sp.]
MQSINSIRTGVLFADKQHNWQQLSHQFMHQYFKKTNRSQHLFSVSEEQGKYIELDSRQSVGTSFAAHHAKLFSHYKYSLQARIYLLESVSKRRINAVRWNWFSAVKKLRTTRLLVARNGVLVRLLSMAEHWRVFCKRKRCDNAVRGKLVGN